MLSLVVAAALVACPSTCRNHLEARLIRHAVEGSTHCKQLFQCQPARTGTVARFQARAMTEKDAIGMRLISGEGASSNYGTTLNRDFAIFAPDRSKFVIVLKRGNLKTNTTEYSVLLYRSAQISRSPKPVVLVSMSSSANRDAISDISWLADNDTVLFIGTSEGEHSELYSIRCSDRAVTRLTHHPTNLESYSSDQLGASIAFLAERRRRAVDSANTARHGFHVGGEAMADLINGKIEDDERELYILKDRVARRLVVPPSLGGKLWGQSAQVWLSPDGRKLVLKLNLTEIPENWSQYRDRWVRRGITQYRPAGAVSWVFRYGLIDLDTGRSRILLDSPIGYSESKVLWSSDSGSVVLSGIYLPLQSSGWTDVEQIETHTFVLEVAVDTLRYLPVTDEPLELEGWENGSAKVLVFAPTSAETEFRTPRFAFFKKEDGRWHKFQQHAVADRNSPEILAEQDLNTPPRIVVLDRSTGHKSLLLDLNPQFRKLRFASVEQIKFRGADDQEIRAGLYLPLDYEPGKHYPLVIQTHGFDPRAFWIDGPYPTAFAAQALASIGISVLQLPTSHNWVSTPEEGPKMVETFERAIAYVKQRGILDEGRIGIVGYSRTGFHVQYALTHSKLHFAAAVIADGSDGGYSQYVQFLNPSPYTAADSESLNGAVPFGPGIGLWADRSPEFALDRVNTPLLIQALNPRSLSFQWATFVALRRLSRPVDLLYLPGAQHILHRPWDRVASQQGTIDWFAFWLLGKEDSDPKKAQQYIRWHDLKSECARTLPN
jgi:dipeptidyl aminopeptidase/acylaminoacyl peptidase